MAEIKPFQEPDMGHGFAYLHTNILFNLQQSESKLLKYLTYGLDNVLSHDSPVRRPGHSHDHRDPGTEREVGPLPEVPVLSQVGAVVGHEGHDSVVLIAEFTVDKKFMDTT